MSKKALGKGIGALLKDIDETIDKKSIIQVLIDSLKPNPYQPRKEFRDESLKELSDSIKLKGILQPIIIESNGDGSYTIISGERRVRAAKLAGLDVVPGILGSYSVVEKLENALIENIQREDLSPLEEATGYKKLMDTFNLSQDEISTKVGKNRSTVANMLRLLKLPKHMKDGLNNGILTQGHARAILSIANTQDQELLYNAIVENMLSVREAEHTASEINKGNKRIGKKKTKSKKSDTRIPELKDFEQKLITVLGTKVELKGSSQRGKIEISYYSMEDLERLTEIILQEQKSL
jgi:ParB family transcriptional regulator, chromosome partitioning protein